MMSLILKNSKIGNHEPMTLMGGVNVLESESIAMKVAEEFAKAASDLNINWIFKGSFDKANRSSISSYRGPGIDEGLRILEKIKETFDVAIITDIHEPAQAQPVAEVCDILQIPAFLCRQTDLVIAAAKTKKIIQFKKPQFLSAPEMKNVIEKCEEAGNNQIILCERGNAFGYNNLVVDMLNFQIMKNLNVPVIFDATHSLQLPGGLGNAAGGRREFLLPLAKAGLSQGIAGLFLEAHPNPDEAKCDGPCAIATDQIYPILSQLTALDTFIKQQESI
ncbi:3-deoxy-8-phosphooctulonate synthase [Gammaproteobacteria bacterium]|nr:3-deoxy-8-phosphooctulonate synthase [Gammaproteobacteria bacterium]MDA9153956.1 3-deoxy-8-phosphooctulonate synthase [Gammaproteobacteria bacterium]MDB9790748.1 3-deoxy-8-phosphooctulonate synthase [Gammaproteobacteria bacterium]MDC0091521.1 3-deoxy-8-phosphooctulonate synthase [Gammaproteobacteria bacterium]MDC1475709.1 3-deoxy-8-phosphooctulonate synthase [Gammaproteobacteria bacterium]